MNRQTKVAKPGSKSPDKAEPIRTFRQYTAWLEQLKRNDPGFKRHAETLPEEYLPESRRYYLPDDNMAFLTEAEGAMLRGILLSFGFVPTQGSTSVLGYASGESFILPDTYVTGFIAFEPVPNEYHNSLDGGDIPRVITVHDNLMYRKGNDGKFYNIGRVVENPATSMEICSGFWFNPYGQGRTKIGESPKGTKLLDMADTTIRMMNAMVAAGIKATFAGRAIYYPVTCNFEDLNPKTP